MTRGPADLSPKHLSSKVSPSGRDKTPEKDLTNRAVFDPGHRINVSSSILFQYLKRAVAIFTEPPFYIEPEEHVRVPEIKPYHDPFLLNLVLSCFTRVHIQI